MTTVIACPACQQNVEVPSEQLGLGQAVHCPGCAHVFTPTSPPPRAVPPPLPADDVPVWERPPEEDLARPLDEDEVPELDVQIEEAEQRRRRREEKKSRGRDTSETGYYGELSRKQRKMMAPHRGATVVALGIISLLFSPCCLLAIGACACGYYAYQMGSHDLQEMYAGRMNRSGESLDKIGRMLGIIGMVVSAPVILLSLIGLIITLVRAIAAPMVG